MSELTKRIEHELAEQAEVYAAVEEDGDALVLSGMIESEEQRQAAFDIVEMIAPGKRVVDDLDIEDELPERILGEDVVSGLPVDEIATTGAEEPSDALEPGDFTDQPILENPFGAAGPGYTAADEEISEGEEAYIPPNDPTRTADNEVLNGFSVSSTDDVSVERSSDGTLGDLAIEEAIVRELAEDSATNGLQIEVTVRRGTAILRGRVGDVVDVENAMEVAARVEGVRDVVDELEVESGAF